MWSWFQKRPSIEVNFTLLREFCREWNNSNLCPAVRHVWSNPILFVVHEYRFTSILHFIGLVVNSRECNQLYDRVGLVHDALFPSYMPPNSKLYLTWRQCALCHRLSSFVHLGPPSFSHIIVKCDQLFIACHQSFQK